MMRMMRMMRILGSSTRTDQAFSELGARLNGEKKTHQKTVGDQGASGSALCLSRAHGGRIGGRTGFLWFESNATCVARYTRQAALEHKAICEIRDGNSGTWHSALNIVFDNDATFFQSSWDFWEF